MKIGQLHAVVKTKPHVKARTERGQNIKGSCVLGKHCVEEDAEIQEGQLHAVMSWSSRDGRRWYKRIHLGCLAKWVEFSYNFRLKPRGGNHGGSRPKGSGPLTVLNPDAMKERQKLVRKRALLLNNFITEWNPGRCSELWKQIKETQQQIGETGVPLQAKLQGHRSEEVREEIMEKAVLLNLK